MEPKAFYSDRARQNIKSDTRKTSTGDAGDESEVENNFVKADRTPRIPDIGQPRGRQGTLIPRESGRALHQGYFCAPRSCTELWTVFILQAIRMYFFSNFIHKFLIFLHWLFWLIQSCQTCLRQKN